MARHGKVDITVSRATAELLDRICAQTKRTRPKQVEYMIEKEASREA